MDVNQRYEVLCQIVRDYGLRDVMERNRQEYRRKLSLQEWQVGHDIALVDNLVYGEGLYPVNYGLAIKRAIERLFGGSEDYIGEDGKWYIRPAQEAVSDEQANDGTT